MAQQLQAVNFIHNKENEVLNAKLVIWQANNEDTISCIVKDRKNNGRFVS